MADRLPIYEIEREIVSRLKSDRRLILSAPTGSGKSTQVPQMLLKHGLLGDGQVVILQPRRLAARLLAARVASELGVKLGEEVGYQIRFENVTSAKTKIRFVTEGVLLRQMIDDPNLRGVSVLLFDEFLQLPRVQRRGHHANCQVRPVQFLLIERAGERDVAIQMPLVKLIEQQRRDAAHIRIVNHLPQQHALGHETNLRFR